MFFKTPQVPYAILWIWAGLPNLGRACSHILGQLADGLEAGWPRMTLDVITSCICSFSGGQLVRLVLMAEQGFRRKQNHAGFSLHLVCCLVGLRNDVATPRVSMGATCKGRGLGRQRSLGPAMQSAYYRLHLGPAA